MVVTPTCFLLSHLLLSMSLFCTCCSSCCFDCRSSVVAITAVAIITLVSAVPANDVVVVVSDCS